MTKYQTAVTAELEKITADLKSIASLNTETGDWVATPASEEMNNADPNDAGDVTESWNERRALMTQLETRYRNLVRAQEKIAAGSYGTCEVCSAPIEEDRLDVNCAARTCKAHLEDEANLPG